MNYTCRIRCLYSSVVERQTCIPKVHGSNPVDDQYVFCCMFSGRIVDGVVCYKDRLVIPLELKQEVLDAIHAAHHQGVSGMNNRVEQSVYWPSIT